MCGITGFLRMSSLSEMDQIVRRMTDSLHSRGPDDSGVWLDEEAGIALGHRRLSILDLSPAGRQPMISRSGRYVISFNGEIYNHLELRNQLDSAGHETSWRGRSDAESLLAYIDSYGFEKALRAARGMFAIALWDRTRKSLSLARDRMGEKPLYYGWYRDTFLFGSELKALKAHPQFAADIDRDALRLLLRHNFIPAPYSIYQGIRKLPAGTWIEITGSGSMPTPAAYWQLATVAEQGSRHPFAGDESDALEQLQALAEQAVRSQMVADVPLGALLSGGVDSSMICALMQAVGDRPVKTFTIGFSEHGHNEADYARAVASHLGTDHSELYVSANDALSLVSELPRIWDEPFADSSQLPTFLVMQLARQHVTVALSGDGGDELFCGYNRYTHGPRLVRQLGWMPPVVRKGLGSLLTAVPVPVLNAALHSPAQARGISLPGDKVHKLGQKLAGHAFRSVDDMYVSLMTEWPDSCRPVIDGDVPPNLLDDRERWPNLDDPTARMMLMDGLVYLPDDILVKVDRSAMAVSLETRAPFLDHGLVEFAWSLPMHFKQREGQGKWLLRRLLDRYVPRKLIDRPKMGFGIPLDQWLRGPLRDWAEAQLAGDRLTREGFFHPDIIREAWEAHCNNRANFGYRLWSILTFQSWLEANG